MPMRDQPDGVHRTNRGAGKPRDYDIYVDGQYAGWVERVHRNRPESSWRVYRDGTWPHVFGKPGGYLAAIEWLAAQHRAAQATAEPVRAAEGASVQVLSPAVADPFRGETFADPLS